MVKPGKCNRSSGSSGGGDNGNKLSVYDFNPDDELVEGESHRMVSKWSPKCPKLNPSPLNKYRFLQFFTGRAEARENCNKEPLEIEDSDDGRKEPSEIKDSDVKRKDLFEIEDSDDESVCGMFSPVSSTSILEDQSSCANPVIDHVNSVSVFPGARSCGSESISSEGKGSGQILANDQEFSVDSHDDQGKISFFPNDHHSPNFQDDCVIDLMSSSSSEQDGYDEGSEHCSIAPFDILEAGVVVHPDVIISGNSFFVHASLTFSRKFIILESFNHIGRDSFALVWSLSDIVMIKSYWCKKLETVTITLSLKSEVQGEAKTIKNITGITMLNFTICDPRWCQTQEAIKSLDTVYEVVWKTVVSIDSSWSEFSPVQQKSGTSSEASSFNCYTSFGDFVYPREDPDAVSVTMKDIELLQPASFINDTIIDFYVKYLEQHLRPEEKHRFHFFNSFFFRKLADLDKEPSTASKGRSAFHSVLRWTRTVNLFEKDYLFIPVNFSLHWSLVIICHPGEIVKLGDEQMHKSPKVPCILHMDSIRGSHRGLGKLFRRYLWEEWKERYKETSQHISSNFLKLPYIMPKLPQQPNSYDCGLFVLHYLECFLDRAPVHFSPDSSTSNFLNKDWFLPAEACTKRGHVRNLVLRIGNSNAREAPLTTVDNYSSRCINEDADKRCQLDTCRSNYSVNMFPTASPPRLRMGCVGRTRESDMLVAEGALEPGDSSRTSVDRTCQRFHTAIPVNKMCNTMSPIEEEEAIRDETPVETTRTKKADSRGRNLLPEINDVDSSPRKSSSLHDEKTRSAPEVLMVSDDEDLGACVVEDSLQEEDDGSPVSRSIANDKETFEQEVESPPNGVMKKPKCSLMNQKGTLTSYFSKVFDCNL